MSALAAIIPAVETASLDYFLFKKAMLNAVKVVERKNTIPVLNAVLIKACRGGANVIGTDCDIFTTTFVPGAVTPDFAAVIDAHKLKNLMDKVKDAARINFTQDGDTLLVHIGKVRLNLNQDIPENDFPVDATFRTDLLRSNVAFTMPSTLLRTALTKVEFAISTEETRYYLHGIFMHYHESNRKLTFAATDGHRLGRYEVPPPEGAEAMDEKGAIIPRKTVGELLRLLRRKDCPAAVVIRATDMGISFAIGDDEMLESKLVDGTFPDYQRVIPTSNPHHMAVRAAEFIDGLKQATAISSERSRAVKLAFKPDEMTISCKDPDFGTASSDLNINCDADPFEVGFNGKYLIEILGQLDGGAMLQLADAGSPGIIKDGADPAVTYVLMPLRV